nr:hypothetical protein [uncultured Methanobrevibacter sp.]
MKLNRILLFGVVLLAFLMIASASASDDAGDNLASENLKLESGDTILTDKDAELVVKNVSPKKTTPIKSKVRFSNDVSKYKQNKYFKIKITNKKTKKPIKNLKFKFKIQLSKKKYRTYTLKTNSKGIAKYSLKNLKPGVHRVTISSKTHEFDDQLDFIDIWKVKKTVTLKMNSKKKVEGEWMFAEYETRNGAQFPRGAFIWGDISDESPGYIALKAKFFFKNKKTGKIITKTAKYPNLHVKLVKGYTPIKTEVVYGTLR